MLIDTLRACQEPLDLSTPGMLTLPLLQELLAQPFLPPPSTLDVSKNQLPTALGSLLAHTSRLHPHLNILDVSWNPIGKDGLLDILLAPFTTLHVLIAQNISLWRGHVDAIAQARWPRSLEHLDLGNNRLTDSGVEALLRSSQINQLKSLYLQENQCSDSTVAHLATCDQLGGLRALNLSTNQLNDDGIRALIGSSCLRGLTHLDLSHNHVRQGTIQALEADTSSDLHTLRLNHTRCGVRAIEALADSTVFAGLDTLCVRDSSLKDSAIKALGTSTKLPGLHTLDLSRNALTDASVTHLERGALASSLTHLNVNSNALTLHGALTLMDVSRFPALRELSLRGNLSDTTHLALLHALPRVVSGELTLMT